MTTQKRKITKKPTIKIDVISLLHNVGLSNKEINAFTPIVKQSAVMNEIGIRSVDKILDNTLEGYDKNGKKFKKYSKSYRDSTKFKIYKGSKRTPDLKLTGNMQSDMDVLSSSSTTVTIGFSDSEEGSKAQGHILGAGHLPKRDFFGLKAVDLKEIMLSVITDYEQEGLLDTVSLLEDFGVTQQPADKDSFFDIFLGEELAS